MWNVKKRLPGILQEKSFSQERGISDLRRGLNTQECVGTAPGITVTVRLPEEIKYL